MSGAKYLEDLHFGNYQFLVGTSEYVISGMLDKIAGSLGVTVAAAGQLITIFHLFMQSERLS